MVSCSICKKKLNPGNVTLFKVPKDDKLREKWSNICGIKFSRYARICSDHFDQTEIAKKGKQSVLLPCAVPKPILFHVEPKEIKSSVSGRNLVINSDFPIEQPSNENLTDYESEANFEIEWLDDSFLDGENISTEETMECQNDDSISEELSTQEELKMYKHQGTQTEHVEFASNSIKELEIEIKELKRQLNETNKANSALKDIFTEGQLRKLHSPGRIQWNWEDISSSICLHASGPRAYNHLYKKGFPLPHPSTLQRWCSKFKVHEGLLGNCITFMKETHDMSIEDKLCVLSFDEMKVAETYEYDIVADVVRKPVNYVQVVMARGLKGTWKLPVFYAFDCPMTVEILNNIISELSYAGYPVVAVVCDNGSSNRKLYKDLGVTMENPSFPHPVNNNEPVFAFADAPHLLKIIRNHYLDSGLLYNNDLITTRTISDLLKYTNESDISITYKLNSEHISVKGAGRQKVKLAAQLFSNTTANAIRRCYAMGMDIYKPLETADFIQLVNDWFDVLNSSLNTFGYPGKEPYGINLEHQNSILDRMDAVMSKVIVPRSTSLLYFQMGIIRTNKALRMLYEYVKKFDLKYVLTRRLNQDILEHFFGAMRSKGGLNDHPSPNDFKIRLRKYLTARNTEYLTGKGNVECDSTEWLKPIKTDFPAPSSSNKYAPSMSGPDFDNVEDLDVSNLEDLDVSNLEDHDVSNLEDLNVSNFSDIGILQEDALEYISGYIIRKLNLEEYECHENSYTWVDQVSKGSLKKPSNGFLNNIKLLESVFNKHNKSEICHDPFLRKRLIEKSRSIEIPEKIKELFFKCRIFFRVRQLNRRQRIRKAKQRILGNKKLLKIKL